MVKLCAFCEHLKQNGNQLEQDLLQGKLTQKEAAEKLGISQPMVSVHLTRHVNPQIKQSIQNKIEPHVEQFSEDTLQKLRKLHTRMEKIAQTLFKDDGWTSNKASFVKEYLHVIETAHKLLGGEQPVTVIQINQIQEQVKTLNQFIIEEACEKCQKKYQEWLKNTKP